jgi:hypothetical protein
MRIGAGRSDGQVCNTVLSCYDPPVDVPITTVLFFATLLIYDPAASLLDLPPGTEHFSFPVAADHSNAPCQRRR